MKKILLCLFLFLPSCIPYKSTFKAVGSPAPAQTWVYLCGLVINFEPEKMEELKTLDTIGKQLNIRFLALAPTHRCPKLENCLCWPHENKEELLQTYKEILEAVENEPIKGYIGFSNGGFFLNSLTQEIELKKPVISIAAGGHLFNQCGPKNNLYLMIGKKDQWHYNLALQFYNQSHNSNLMIHLIEYEQGHVLPFIEMKNLLETLMR